MIFYGYCEIVKIRHLQATVAEQNPVKCVCIAVLVLNLISIASIAALIAITTTQPEVRQDANQTVTIGDVAEIHSDSQHFGMMTSVVHELTLFRLVAIVIGFKHYIDRRNHQDNHEKYQTLEDGIKDIRRNQK